MRAADITATTRPPSRDRGAAPHQQSISAVRGVEMTATPDTDTGARHREPTVEGASRTPVLITEQEVMFGTAVVVRAKPTVRRWTGTASVLLTSIRRMVASSRRDARPVRHDCPRHYAF